jgi:hypothetical protein
MLRKGIFGMIYRILLTFILLLTTVRAGLFLVQEEPVSVVRTRAAYTSTQVNQGQLDQNNLLWLASNTHRKAAQ